MAELCFLFVEANLITVEKSVMSSHLKFVCGEHVGNNKLKNGTEGKKGVFHIFLNGPVLFAYIALMQYYSVSLPVPICVFLFIL